MSKRMRTGCCLLSFLLGTGLMLLGEANSSSVKDGNRIDYFSWFSSIHASDLPTYVARVVQLEPELSRSNVTMKCVSAAVASRPGAAAAIVGAVAEIDPGMAAVAAEAAVAREKKLAPVIARAAVGAAPAQCRAVVAAVCRIAPEYFKAVACAVAELKPEKAVEILDGVCDALPELAPHIRQVIAEFRGVIPSVREVLEQAVARLLQSKEKPPADSVFMKPLSEWPFEPAMRARGRSPYGGVDYSRP